MTNENDSVQQSEAIIKKIKVENMLGNRSGRAVPNQFEIVTEDGVYFQSYASIIAFIPRHSDEFKTILDANKWDYSTTTGKYRNKFLNEGIADTRAKIKSGQYILADLN